MGTRESLHQVLVSTSSLLSILTRTSLKRTKRLVVTSTKKGPSRPGNLLRLSKDLSLLGSPVMAKVKSQLV